MKVSLGIGAMAAGCLAAGGVATAAPAPAGHPACPAPSEASYSFTCVPSPDGLTQRICAPSKGCADVDYDKMGNKICQKVSTVQVPTGAPLVATDPSNNVFYAVCDGEMALVRALPALPLGSILPTFNSGPA